MTSSNGNIFRITGILRGEFTGHGWNSRTKASDEELWWINGWVNNRDAGDPRRRLAHYDVSVMFAGIGIYQEKRANSVVVDAFAPHFASTLVAMVLTE